MSIKLSYNSTLYSYDGQLEAYVTNSTVLEVLLYFDGGSLGTMSLIYTQGSVRGSVQLKDGRAEIPGKVLSSGSLRLSLLTESSLTNEVEVFVTKIESTTGLTDDDPHYTLDRKKRLIAVPGDTEFLAIQHDHNSEIITFKFPRYADGVDLGSKSVRVNFQLPDGTLDYEGCTISSQDESYLVFTWTISNKTTPQAGTVKFSVEFFSTGYRWQTRASSLEVLPSLYPTSPDAPTPTPSQETAVLGSAILGTMVLGTGG